MPEGDTVWLHARRLNEALAGGTLVHSDLRLPQLATVDLAGYAVREVVSRGKHLMVRLQAPPSACDTGAGDAGAGDAGAGDTGAGDTGWSLHSHLRMEGTWGVYRAGEPWRKRPAHLIRVVLETERVAAVGYHLHDVALVPTTKEDELVGHLGPDLLGPDWDPDEAVRRLCAAPARDIGTALLDQRNLAGIGNLYKAEICFLRGISPWARVDAVPDLPAVVDLARRLLHANRERWAQVTTGDTRRGRQVWVFERSGKPCLRCATLVRSAQHGGGPIEDRLTYWCPSCQPGPSPAGQRRPPASDA